MVIMNSYGKTVWRSICGSLVRFLAILSIIALGVGFFAGLKVTTPSFVDTGNQYINDYKMFDFRLISTIGFDEEDIDKIKELDCVSSVAGAYWSDVVTDDNAVVRIHSITQGVNELKLESGRMPTSSDELVVDGYHFDSSIVGKKLKIVEASNDNSVLEQLTSHEFTIVGTVRSPLYMNFQRGTSDVGSGSISYYAYGLTELFDKEYYEEAYVYCNSGFYIFSDEYEAFAETTEQKLKDIVTDIEVDRYNEILADAWEELNDAKTEFEDKRREAIEELNDAQKEMDDGRIELRDAKRELTDARTKLDDAAEEISQGYSEVYSNQDTIDTALSEVESGIAQITEGLSDIAEKREELQEQLETATAGLGEITEAMGQLEIAISQMEQFEAMGSVPPIGNITPESEDIASGTIPEGAIPGDMFPEGTIPEGAVPSDMFPDGGIPEGMAPEELISSGMIPEGYENLFAGDGSDTPKSPEMPDLATLKAQYGELEGQKALLEGGIAQINEGLELLDTTEEDLNGKLAELNGLQAELEEGQNKIQDARQELRDAQREVDDGEIEYTDGVNEYEDGLKEFHDGVNEYYDGLQEFNDEMGLYSRVLDYEFRRYDDACDIEPEVYALGRDTNVGYICFDGDSKIVDGVAKVFPIFFFAIAALVCSTTMQRMVSDERGQIGTMRALGYSSTAVMMKYVIYSGSADLIGCLAGFAIGTKVFPYVIWSVYAMMYGFAEITFKSSALIFVVCLAASLLCSVGVTVVTAEAEMRGMPAELIRPKAPPAGKRILLERFGALWNRLPFLHKVSLRNIFRFKKRMFMMIIGIAGCTSLVITGFGLNDSIKNIVGFQYDNVLIYDVSINFDDDYGMTKMQKAIAEADDKFGTSSKVVYAVQENITHTGEDIIRDVNLIVSDADNTSDAFCGVSDGELMPWPGDNEIAVSSKLAKSNNLKAGDSITFGYGDNGATFTLKIAYVFDNYIFHYAYMNADTYEAVFGKEYDPNFAFISRFASDGVTEIPYDTDYDYGGFISSNNDVVSWSAVNESREMFQNTMEQLNAVVWLVIICAALLAFIVLFNLNNINITERVREIATLKVLGFNKGETGSYVFRENFILVIAGFIVGVPLGKALHAFVISQIKMDTVTFVVQIFKISYLYSFLLVILFAVITDLVMRKKIRKIDMAESLKSIE